MNTVGLKQIWNVFVPNMRHSKSLVMNETGSFGEAASTRRVGWLAVAFTITTGATIATLLSKSVSNLLEEFDLYIP